MSRPQKLAFVVPSLSPESPQSEETVQLLLFLAARLEAEVSRSRGVAPSTHVISADGDTDGWPHLASLFSERARRHVKIEALPEPETPNLAMASHKPAYNLFELLKRHAFDEIHALDLQGLVYYPTQAKRLGLAFLDVEFCVHVVGGTLFRRECEDQLLDDIAPMMDDLLERGSVERADVVHVHDRKAWHWYRDKLDASAREQQEIRDLSWAAGNQVKARTQKRNPDAPGSIIYHGTLGAADGLPLFCDMIDRALPRLPTPIPVHFIGPPRPIGGMDAVSYIRLRSQRWRVPVSVRRDLSIADEIDLVTSLDGVVFGSTLRREGLRARLLAGAGVCCLGTLAGDAPSRELPGGAGSMNPDELAEAVANTITGPRPPSAPRARDLVELWASGRPAGASRSTSKAEPQLRLDNPAPRVSVCVTHYNRPRMLRRALDSLRRQTYSNFEVIVVDDGTPDPAARQQLAAIRSEIEKLGWRLLVQPNRYLGAARNHAVQHAQGEYLLFMDDDNVAKPHEIETFVAVAQRTRADIVTAFCDVFRTEEDLEGTPPLRHTPFGPDPALGAFSNCYGDANALFTHKAFTELGGFTEDYGITHEDWELFCRASLAGMKMVCIPEPLFWYRVDENGMFRGEQTQLHKNANLRRHIRPYLEQLPFYQATLVQLAQGLSTQLPVTTVGARTREDRPRLVRPTESPVPFARVAVITRTKDRPLLLRRAVASVLDQTYKDFVLIIVNDGGDRECCERVLDEFREALGERLVVLHHPHSLGMQVASNAGLSRCDSDFVVIHDDDDSWDPRFLARTVSHLDESSHRTGGVVCWSQIVVEELDDNGEMVECQRFIYNDRLESISLLDLAAENRFPPIAFLFRRAALEAVGAFDERFGVLGDWEFNLRLLQRFEIDVIREPLANYHHRNQNTTGVYGNSVHAQNEVHRAKRVELLNSFLREGEGDGRPLPLCQTLALGDLRAEQGREFQRLQEHVLTIDASLQGRLEKLDREIGHLGRSLGVRLVESLQSHADRCRDERSGRNLFANGDFRLWPTRITWRKNREGNFRYSELFTGFFIIHDGVRASYEVEQMKWREGGCLLPYGKTYLHLESRRPAENGSFFALSYVIRSVLLLAGKKLTVSGISRLTSQPASIHVGGRYDLGRGNRLEWPDGGVTLGESMQAWSCTLECPRVEPGEVQLDHCATVLIKLPPDQPFTFDLTDLQIEIGDGASSFEYL